MTITAKEAKERRVKISFMKGGFKHMAEEKLRRDMLTEAEREAEDRAQMEADKANAIAAADRAKLQTQSNLKAIDATAEAFVSALVQADKRDRDFLCSIKEQMTERKLSEKQAKIASKVISKYEMIDGIEALASKMVRA